MSDIYGTDKYSYVYRDVGNKAKSDTHQPQEKRLSFD